jgi:hypothetical protein
MSTIMSDHALHAIRIRPAATFVVLASGYLGRRIARLAILHAEFDMARRRVICSGDADFPNAARIDAWRSGTSIAAVVLNDRGEVCQRLDTVSATAEAWIEDAFLRASSEPG